MVRAWTFVKNARLSGSSSRGDRQQPEFRLKSALASGYDSGSRHSRCDPDLESKRGRFGKTQTVDRV
ncbi:hypothetical protein CKA32_002230 [Geitlerinema sp. FC II]|nr:hypothetical protein CKA32_002230 [Geitlerinema sp. FC II]